MAQIGMPLRVADALLDMMFGRPTWYAPYQAGARVAVLYLRVDSRPGTAANRRLFFVPIETALAGSESTRAKSLD